MPFFSFPDSGRSFKRWQVFKSCSVCGKIHDTRTICRAGRIYSGGDERKLRSTYKWTMKSQQIREDANHLCEVCRDRGEISFDDLSVHHIVKVRDDKGLLLDDSNLICLCSCHHKQADNNELDKDYLLRLAQERINHKKGSRTSYE